MGRGSLHGHEEVRHYWTRQWAEINPKVEPIGFEKLGDSCLKVSVHQFVKDENDAVLFDRTIYHTYAFENDLIKKMEISKK